MTAGILPEAGHEALVDEMMLVHGNRVEVHVSYLSKLQRNWRQANPSATLLFSRVSAVDPNGKVIWYFSQRAEQNT